MKQGFLLFVSLIAVLVAIQTLALLGFPVWIILMALPLVAYGQIYALNRYNFRDSLDFELIPDKGFEKNREALELAGDELADLGFIKFDEFCLRLSSNVIAYIYHHRTEPIYFCQYDFGTFQMSDFVTKFDNGFT